MKMRTNNTPPPTSLRKINVGGGSVGRRTDVPNVPSAPRPKDKPKFAIDKEKESGLPPFLTLNELLADAKKHEAEQREAEWSYRDGFFDGWLQCARAIVRLYRLGYVRPRDIATLLESHDEALRQWRDEAEKEDPLSMGSPRFVRPSWSEVRGRVFKRDNNRCTQCGSPDNLEAHHLEAVCDGGLSIEGNLTTLCRQCHRGF